MTDQLWSWVLGFIWLVGLVGFYLAGKKVWWCWYIINIANQALWFTYAVVTEQWGFLVVSLIYMAVFLVNTAGWTREHLRGSTRALP